MLRRYPAFLSRTFERWGVDTIVHIGDLVDWHAINFHGKHADAPGVKDEVRKARRQVQNLYQRFPEATWIIGNHDDLPARRADAIGLPSDAIVNPVEYWEVHDWSLVERFGYIEIDGVLYSHGEIGSQGLYAAINQAKAETASVAIGHLHGNAGVSWVANKARRLFGLSVGCGVDWRVLAMKYGRKFGKKPLIGCGIVIDGSYATWEPMAL
ncbi:hypothetical protein KOR42_33020 [Thalassoglobus neptunius]|uniref:Calcineurin-like phosphoesterase domain-containing protein n=2 Tax=Thalassoglobus neptunius TaxID=1938619 RepID=A0A5C5WNX9_9PLAN|nr:hypothetical protein KOR42_33020 [Thalassoglobus neptunius]